MKKFVEFEEIDILFINIHIYLQIYIDLQIVNK